MQLKNELYSRNLLIYEKLEEIFSTPQLNRRNDRYSNGLGPRLVRMRLCSEQEIHHYRPIGRPPPDPYKSLFFINPHTLSGSTSRLKTSMHNMQTSISQTFWVRFPLKLWSLRRRGEGAKNAVPTQICDYEMIPNRRRLQLAKTSLMTLFTLEPRHKFRVTIWLTRKLWQVVPKYSPCSHLTSTPSVTSASALNCSTTLSLAIGYSKEL